MTSRFVHAAALAVIVGLTGFAGSSLAGDGSCETKASCPVKAETVAMEGKSGCEAKGGCEVKSETVGMENKETEKATIVQTAETAGDFSTLVAAVKAAGLEETLSGGDFTVFAPTDEAFAKLPKETLDSLLKPENKEKLKAILTYHVISGETKSCCVEKDAMVKKETVNGKSVEIKNTDGKISVNGAQVVKSDIQASNGVIHVIDTVLLPPES